MLYGLPGVGTNFIIPPTIYPSPLYQHDSGPSPSKPTDSVPAKRPQGDKQDVGQEQKSKEAEVKKEEEEEEFSLRPGGGGGSGLRFTQPKPQQGKKGKKKGKGRQEKDKTGMTPKKGRDSGRYGSVEKAEPPAASTGGDTGRNMSVQVKFEKVRKRVD